MSSTADGSPRFTKKYKGKKGSKSTSKVARSSSTMVARAVSAALKARGLSKQAIQLKHSFSDTYAFTVNAALNVGYTPVTPVYQGTGGVVPLSGGTPVIGADITCKYLTFRGIFYNTSSAGPHAIRLICVEDYQPNLALNLWANGTSNQNVLQVGDWASLYDATTPKRYKVLFDKISYLGCPQQTANNTEIIEGKIDLYNKVMSFVPNSAVTTAILPQNVNYGFYLVADAAFTGCLSFHTDFAFTNV